jgi:hypothetical protein
MEALEYQIIMSMIIAKKYREELTERKKNE